MCSACFVSDRYCLVLEVALYSFRSENGSEIKDSSDIGALYPRMCWGSGITMWQ